MKNRKSLALILVAIFVAVMFAGCSTGTPTNKTQSAAASQSVAASAATQTAKTSEKASPSAVDWSKYTIGFSQDWNQNEWTQMMRDDIVATCNKYGLKCTVTDAGNSGEKQISDIEDLITLKVNAILISTYHADTIGNAAKAAMDAKIPVIVLSSEIPGVTPTVHITADSILTGETCGKEVMEKFPNGAKIVQLSGKEGSVVNQMRGKGFHNIIDKDKKYEVLAQLTCNYSRSEALTAMEDQLHVYGDKIQVVYTHNDDMALGAIQAIEDAGYKANVDGGIFVISAADGIYDEVFDVVEAGKMVTHYYSTFGVEGVEMAMKVLQGQKVDAKITTEAPKIDKSNVAQFRKK